MSQPPFSSITINDIPVNHAVAGEGRPLLLLHGWGAHIALVWPLAQAMIPHGYRVYALDMPGFGQTPTPPTAWTVYDYARFVVAYLDAQGLEKVDVFGHSFGGRLGLILGADYTARIGKMALADAAGIKSPIPWPVALRLNVYKGIRDGLYRIGARTLADTLRAAYNKRYGSTDFQQVSGVMRETFVKVVNEDLRPHAQRVQRPTLLFWGDQDQDTPLWQGQMLEKLIPDAGLIVHKGAGHYSYLDALPETVRVLDYFLKH
jgi:pimeloyl-ACP methyl ester carboxylesterase